MARFVFRVLCTAAVATAFSLPRDAPVTPVQRQALEQAHRVAELASRAAEAELLSIFSSVAFRVQLVMNRAFDIVFRSSASLLADLKEALASLEWISNFGVDEQLRVTNPGAPAMDFKTIDAWGGRIPNMWELKVAKSPLVNGTPEGQWDILNDAEVGLYGLPAFAGTSDRSPTASEAYDRPQYLSGNLRRHDKGVERYGVYGLMLRGDVVRSRSLVVAADSGGWVNSCNDSAKPMRAIFKIGKFVFDCSAMTAGGAGRVVPATPDHLLHALLGNTRFFDKVGGSLPRVLHQLLSPGAGSRPIETLMFLEGGFLGALRTQDAKLLVASFPGVFGTASALHLRAFCARHKVPLAWAIGNGETSKDVMSNFAEWLPFDPVNWPVGGHRLIDPTSWKFTNSSFAPTAFQHETWRAVEAEVARALAVAASPNVTSLNQASWNGWFARLGEAGGAKVWPLRPGDGCNSLELCFGVFEESLQNRACLCRKMEKERALGSDAVVLI